MSYGKCTIQAVTAVPAEIIFVKSISPSAPHEVCHAVWLHNHGTATIHYTYNIETNPNPDPATGNSFELLAGEQIILGGHDGEQIKRMRFLVSVGTGVFKWARMW